MNNFYRYSERKPGPEDQCDGDVLAYTLNDDDLSGYWAVVGADTLEAYDLWSPMPQAPSREVVKGLREELDRMYGVEEGVANCSMYDFSPQILSDWTEEPARDDFDW